MVLWSTSGEASPMVLSDNGKHICPLMNGVSTGKYCTWFELIPNPCSPVANGDLTGYRRLEPELARYP